MKQSTSLAKWYVQLSISFLIGIKDSIEEVFASLLPRSDLLATIDGFLISVLFALYHINSSLSLLYFTRMCYVVRVRELIFNSQVEGERKNLIKPSEEAIDRSTTSLFYLFL